MPGFDLSRFHELLRTEAFGRNLVFEPSVGSTMDLARDAARHGAAEGTVALADEQRAGRGRLGRSWITPPALNLASTIILRPWPEAARQLPMLVPLAIVEAVRDVTPAVHADIKWPNDVQVGGKKLAGVLIESSTDDAGVTALVGAGINVNFDPREHDEIRDLATSFAAELDHHVEREAVLAAYLLHLERLYEEAKAGVSMRDRWRARLVTLGQRVAVTESSRVTDGVAEDVGDDGSLLVRRADGTLVTIEAGDVTLRT